MDQTKSKLAAFFDNDDEESSFPQKPVDDQKRSQYVQGRVRKSRREKEKDAAEARKKEEEEEAARAYAEFLDSFEGEDGKRGTGISFVKAGESASASVKGGNSSKAPRGPARERLPASPPPAPSAHKPKGQRAMDTFLEEIKREQAHREAKYARHAQGRSVTAMAAYDSQTGSKDRGSPETSNIFVANLPPHITEQALGTFFARVGPVGSVKIMWPRGDATSGPGADMTSSRRSKSSSLSGFVSFMRRKDAEVALREFDGFDWGGCILRVGWSKAVPLASKPMFAIPRSRSRERDRHASRSRSRSRSAYRDRHHSRSPRRPRSRRSRSRSRTRSRSRSHSRSRYRRRSYSRSRRSRSPRRRRSRSPEFRDARHNEEEVVTDTFIRAVAAEVKGHGARYEEALREREQGNPKYAFMLNKNHRRHNYYRKLIQSENILEPEFDDEGYNSVYSTDSAEDSERERGKKTSLNKLARKRFEAMLRAMSGKRGELARCMAFSLEHAEAAAEVADIIVASLLVEGTAVPRKVARLHLICDILHNSAASVPSAWKFRQEFQSRLGIVFDHLANIYHSFPGRITADIFKKQITAVVDIWEDWIVFPPDFTSELRMRLEGVSTAQVQPQEESVPKETQEAPPTFASRFKKAITSHGLRREDGVDGEPMDDGIDGEPLGDVGRKLIDDDVDGISIDDDVDGIPIDDDVDGIPMDDDVDGKRFPIDDDIDGFPIDSNPIHDNDDDNLDGEPIGDDVDGDHNRAPIDPVMSEGNIDDVPLEAQWITTKVDQR